MADTNIRCSSQNSDCLRGVSVYNESTINVICPQLGHKIGIHKLDTGKCQCIISGTGSKIAKHSLQSHSSLPRIPEILAQFNRANQFNQHGV